MLEANTTTMESAEPTEKPRLSWGLVGVALVLPLIAGVVLCFVTSFPLALGISVATIVVTATLVAIDASRLSKLDLKYVHTESAGLLFVCMCLMWVIVYPIAFFRRSAVSSPNLGFVSIFVALFFVGCPFIYNMMVPAGLPTCTSVEVVQLLEKVIRSTLLGATTKSIDGHRELRYDKTANVREGECIAHTEIGDIPVKFFVEWQDRTKNLFQVRLSEPELPTCTSPVVMQLLEKAIRSTPFGETTKSIDGHRELRYDEITSVREGECIAHTEAGDLPLKFFVEWQGQTKGILYVRFIESKLPSCTREEIAQLLEQVIRNTPLGARTKSIDGHRELRYDEAANVRYGECIAHTEAGDVPVKFLVEWQDRSKGMFQVRLSEPELPTCTSQDIVQLLEQFFRATPLGAKMKSIDGHRELSYDAATQVRNGECVAHTEVGDVPVKFLVEWKDRSKGLFQVKIIKSSD